MRTPSSIAKEAALWGLTSAGGRLYYNGTEPNCSQYRGLLGKALTTELVKDKVTFIPSIIMHSVGWDLHEIMSSEEGFTARTYMYPIYPKIKKTYKSTSDVLKYSFGINPTYRIVKLINEKGSTYLGGPGFIADSQGNPIVVCGYNCVARNKIFHVQSPVVLVDSRVPRSEDIFKKYVYNYLIPYFSSIQIHPNKAEGLIPTLGNIFMFDDYVKVNIQIQDLSNMIFRVPEARAQDFGEGGIYDFLIKSYEDGEVLR